MECSFESRNLRNGKKLSDIDKQYLLDDEKQLLLPVLFSAGSMEKQTMFIMRFSIR